MKRALGLADESDMKHCKWNANPEWCSLCLQPMTSWALHRTGGGAMTHCALEVLFQNFLREGNRRSFPLAVYRDAGLLSAPFASLLSLASFTEQDRRCRLFHLLSELKLSVFWQREGWYVQVGKDPNLKVGNYSTHWASSSFNSRTLGYLSLRPAVARCIIGLFPKVSSGVLSMYLEKCDTDNLESIYHYLSLEKLFLPGFETPVCRYGRCNVVKTIGDNLKEILIKRPNREKPQERILATFALRSLAAEVVINQTEELAQRLEATWKHLGRPVEWTAESLATTHTTNPMKERWDDLFEDPKKGFATMVPPIYRMPVKDRGFSKGGK